MSNTIPPDPNKFIDAANNIIKNINVVEESTPEATRQSKTEQTNYKTNNKKLLLSMSTRFTGLSKNLSKIPILGQFSIVFDVFAFVLSFAEDDALTTLMIKTIEVLIQYLIFINVINRCRIICLETIGCTYLDIAKKMIDYYTKSNQFELGISYKTVEMFALDDEILNEKQDASFNLISNSSNSAQSKIKEIKKYYKGKLPNYKQLEHLIRITAIDTTEFEGDLYGFINVLKDNIKNSIKNVNTQGFKATFRSELFSIIQQRLTIFNSKMSILQNKFTNLLIQLNYNNTTNNTTTEYNTFLLKLYASEEYKLFISPVAITLETLYKISDNSIQLKDELDSVEVFSNDNFKQTSKGVVAGFGNDNYSLHGTYELTEKGKQKLAECNNPTYGSVSAQSYKELSNKLQVSSKGQQPAPQPVKKKWFLGLFGGAKKTKSKTYNRRKNKRKGKKRITKKRKHNKNYN
jgi:hypothetical protein